MKDFKDASYFHDISMSWSREIVARYHNSRQDGKREDLEFPPSTVSYFFTGVPEIH